MLTNGEDTEKVFSLYGKMARHIHISVDHLGPITNDRERLLPMGAQIIKSGYQHYVSIEMRKAEEGNWSQVRGCLSLLKEMFA